MSKLSSNRSPQDEILYCKSCGNDDRFVQVAYYEAHLVNRNLDYLRLLYSEIERYDCYVCGVQVEPTPVDDIRQPRL